jgi:hypothetical protein
VNSGREGTQYIGEMEGIGFQSGVMGMGRKYRVLLEGATAVYSSRTRAPRIV